ncbi:MAG: tetratricopeptide repeat protein [Gemmatimonadetes bacterium]|nr:tetratricopeptide repeat protein [Gemmatimonadota bacterium]
MSLRPKARPARGGVRQRLKTVAVALLTGFLVPRAAIGQAAECAGPDCPHPNAAATLGGPGLARPPQSVSIEQIWVAAGELHALKLEFVAALRRFTQAQAGTFGDEAAGLRTSLDAMRRALGRWDGAIAELEAALASVPRTAEIHVALGTIYLDRHRPRDALRELGAAERRDATGLDVYTLQALAHGLLGDDAAGIQALEKASALDPDNPVHAYHLAQHYIALDRRPQAADALRRFLDRLSPRPGSCGGQKPETCSPKPGARSQSGAASIAPFERVDLLRQAAGVAPIFPLARYADGYAALWEGNFPSAVSRLGRAIDRDPINTGNAAVRQRRAEAGAALRAGQIGLALDRLQALVDSAPNDSEARRLLGLACFIDDQYERSLEHLQAAIRLSPDDERARLLLADVLVAAGRSAEAERALTETIRIIPQSGQAHHRLGQLYQAQAILPQAVQAFERSAAFTPIVGRDHLYQTIGGLAVSRADFDGAVAAYAKRIEVNPNSAAAHRQLGEIYFLQGRDEAALAEFSAAAWLDPQDAAAHAGRGQVLLRTDRHADAVEAFRRAVALGGGNAEVRSALGAALIRLGDRDQGRREIEISGRLHAETIAEGRRQFESNALRRQAAQSLAAGRDQEAIGLFEKAVALAPEDSRSYRDLGVALLQAARPREAVAILEKAQAMEVTAEGYRHLADAYRALQDEEGSQRQQALYERMVRDAKLAPK